MHIFLRSPIFLFIIVLLQACTEIMEIELPQCDEKIIVNSFFTTGDRIKVHLSRSVPVLDSYIPLCDNAFVRLTEKDIVVDTLYRDGDYYYSHIMPGIARDYSLIINVPGMDSVVCHDIIPERVPILNYTLVDSVMIAEDDLTIMQFEFSFNDPPGKNYYEIEMDVKPRPLSFMKNTDPVLISTGLLDYQPSTLIFDDKLFEHGTASVKVNYAVEAYVFPRIDDGQGYQYQLNVSFRSISESYYRYKQKQIVYLFSLEPDIFTGQAEPVQLYSNIDGGYGIFAGYSSDDRAINVVVQ